MADYFPLKDNTRLEYLLESTEFEGKAKIYIDLFQVSKKVGSTTAQAKMTFTLRDTTVDGYTITKNKKWVTTANGVIIGGRKEFPLPVKAGIKWDESPDASEITSLSEKVSVKAGKFEKCMKVVTQLSGGDSGKSERYYAPGIGYILEKHSAEDKTCKIELVSVSKLSKELLEEYKAQKIKEKNRAKAKKKKEKS
ncbi:MAG: hypothetical protein KAR84_00555 [Elusimicrobiales bacterium]|nr:hypothetical protein [Elusimicrobiales bacterium]MCK5357461.1 hypothetical protein [Elusimicrobiales bacterium]